MSINRSQLLSLFLGIVINFTSCSQFTQSKINPGLYQTYIVSGKEIKEGGPRRLTISDNVGFVKLGVYTLSFDATGLNPMNAQLFHPATEESVTYSEVVDRYKNDYGPSSDILILQAIGRRLNLEDVIRDTFEKDSYDGLTIYERFKSRNNQYFFWNRTTRLPVPSYEVKGKVEISDKSLIFKSDNGRWHLVFDKID